MEWQTTFELGQLMVTDIVPAIVLIILIWVYRWFGGGIPTTLAGKLAGIALIGIIISVTVINRWQAETLHELLVTEDKIKIYEGELEYGDYVLPQDARHRISYREVSIGNEPFNFYHKRYQKDHSCFGPFYESDYPEGSEVRIHVRWFPYRYVWDKKQYSVQTPCILKVERRQ